MIKNKPDASSCFSVQIPSPLPSPQTTSAAVWNEVPQPVILSNQECTSHDDKSIIHIVIISVRSIDRYEEAEVHLKSIIFNRSLTPKNKRAPIAIHMIVDKGGHNYFRDLYDKENLKKFDDVHILIHDFEYVCVNPLENFLSSLNMKGNQYITTLI